MVRVVRAGGNGWWMGVDFFVLGKGGVSSDGG